MTTNLRTRWAASLGFAVALLMSAGAAMAQEDQQSDSDQRKENGQNNVRQLEAFELEHRSPQELQQILSLRWHRGGQLTPAASRQPTIGQPQRVTAGFRGTGDDQPLFAADQENKLLFVRGSEEQIKDIKELVDAFDVKEDELKSLEFGDVKLIPIRKERANQVASTLGQLQLDHKLFPMQNVALIAVYPADADDDEQTADQIRKVVSKLKADEGIGKSDNDSKDGDSEDRDSEDADSEDADSEDADSEDGDSEDADSSSEDC